jgi:hypothetical protein
VPENKGVFMANQARLGDIENSSFLRPQLVTLLVFFVMIFFLPVVYVSIFPAYTGVPFPREREMEWILKVEWYGASLDEYLYGTDGEVSLLLGILYRNYFINRIGILLLLLYYTLASAANALFKKIPFLWRTLTTIFFV